MEKGGDSSPGSPGSGDSDSEEGDEAKASNTNRSLDGIVLHIMADIMQSFGLTVAGAILWCVSTLPTNTTFRVLSGAFFPQHFSLRH